MHAYDNREMERCAWGISGISRQVITGGENDTGRRGQCCVQHDAAHASRERSRGTCAVTHSSFRRHANVTSRNTRVALAQATISPRRIA